LIARHPGLELAFASANEQRGQRVRIGASEVTYVATEDAPLDSAEVVFTALPHGTSAKWVGSARATGARVVDLSSDFRPGAANAVGETAAPYGLTELMRAKIPGAEIVANPGCYPTAILLGIAPLLKEGWVVPGATINVSAASGVTGAGYSARPDMQFAEVAEDFRAYAVGNEHRHIAEMQAVAKELGGRDVVRRNVVRMSISKAANVRQPTLIIISAIDNLVKGAAGQALQNANVLLGLSEQAGLPV